MRQLKKKEEIQRISLIVFMSENSLCSQIEFNTFQKMYLIKKN